MSKTQTEMLKIKLFYDGQCLDPFEGKALEAINPSTGKPFALIARASQQDVDQAVCSARKAFDEGPWPRMSVKKRQEYLKKISQCIRKNAKELAELETLDTGKTSKQTTFIDVPTCADTFDYFSNLDDPLKEERLSVAAPVKSTLIREPLGVVACIIPWNYPLIMFGWKVAPALLAGNTIVFKPSQYASVSIMRLMELFPNIDLPAGVLNVITGTGNEAGEALINHPGINMINFTGGTETGKSVMAKASAGLKKVCLELGGKSPNIVFADCNKDAALGGAMSAIFMNQGQMCVAGSRLILEEGIYNEFIDKLVDKTKKLKIGATDSFETEFGPLISQKQRQNVLNYIEKGKQDGACLLCGGKVPEGKEFAEGFYLEPTIFGDVQNDMTIAREEIFGPVLSVIKFQGKEEAIKIANDTPYGLAAMIWTSDQEKASDVSRKLQCGTVWINTYGGFYNEAPFGGYKQSGIGRELGIEGIWECTQIKHVCLDQTPGGIPLAASWF